MSENDTDAKPRAMGTAANGHPEPGRMTGLELKKLWTAAQSKVKECSAHIGRLGSLLRAAGYDILFDGDKTCDFSERDWQICYSADRCDGPWHLPEYFSLKRGCPEGSVGIPGLEDWMLFNVWRRTSIRDRLMDGVLRPASYVIRAHDNREWSEVSSGFVSLGEAEAEAKRLCLERCNERLLRPAMSKFYSQTPVDDAQRAREEGELRHYTWFSRDENDEKWMSVNPKGSKEEM